MNMCASYTDGNLQCRSCVNPKLMSCYTLINQMDNWSKHIDINSNKVCLYLFDGKCAHRLCLSNGKSCPRNSGESCYFFIPEHKLIETKKQEAAQTDNVNHPNHYCQGGIECIKAIEASMTSEEFQGYCKGNVMKYVWRFREKNGLEDLKKAQVYLGWMIESKEKQEKSNVN